jgi:hypothetical protein
MSQFDESLNPPNPYQAPLGETSGFLDTATSASGGVTGKTVEMLRQTRPWVRFLSILGFVFAALMLAVGVIGGAVGMATGGPTGWVALLYIPLALIYLMPSIYLNRYAGRIRDFELRPRLEQLDGALEAQKSFWRFVGIMMVVVLVAYALLIVGLIATGILGALR